MTKNDEKGENKSIIFYIGYMLIKVSLYII